MVEKDLDYCKLILYDDYLEMIWTTKTENMTEERYKEIMLEYANFVEEYKPKRIFVDILDNKFAVFPELQKWTDKKIISRTFAAGLRKNSYLSSSDVVAAMSVDQLLDEENAKQKSVRFFNNKEKALKWLLAD